MVEWYELLFWYVRMIPFEFWLFEFLTILYDVAISSSSKWDPVWFSKQWPEFFESGLVLSWKTIEDLTFVDWCIAIIIWLGDSCIRGCVIVWRGSSCGTRYPLVMFMNSRWVPFHLRQRHSPLAKLLEHSLAYSDSRDYSFRHGVEYISLKIHIH